MNYFVDLLNENPKEQKVQRFLEENPSMICGADYVMDNAVISKLRLGADHATDFAYVNPQSGCTYLHLIEIEKPSKRIFKKNDEFTHEFYQAYQQVEDWLGWCSRNRDGIREILEPLREKSGDLVGFYNPRGLLIFGRDSEINSVRRRERWQQKVESSEFIKVRTFDGYAREKANFIPPTGNPLDYLKTLRYTARGFRNKLSA